MRKLALVMALACSLALSAGAVTINGVDVPQGAVLETGTTWVTTTDGDIIGGIGIINRILDGANQTVWESGDNGTELVFVFDGLDFNNGTTLGDSDIFTDGGFLDFYTLSAGTFAVTGDLGADTSNITSNGTLFLSTDLVPFDAGETDDVTTEGASGSGGAAGTFWLGTGFLSVDGGAAQSEFDTNTQLYGSDIAWDFSLREGELDTKDDVQQETDEYNLSGSSSFRGTVVPEPATLLLLGAGLAGLGARRRFSRKN